MKYMDIWIRVTFISQSIQISLLLYIYIYAKATNNPLEIEKIKLNVNFSVTWPVAFIGKYLPVFYASFEANVNSVYYGYDILNTIYLMWPRAWILKKDVSVDLVTESFNASVWKADSLNPVGYMLFANFAFLTDRRVPQKKKKMKASIIFTNVYSDLDIRHLFNVEKFNCRNFHSYVVSRRFQREKTTFIYKHSNNVGIL